MNGLPLLFACIVFLPPSTQLCQGPAAILVVGRRGPCFSRFFRCAGFGATGMVAFASAAGIVPAGVAFLLPP